MQLAEGGIHRLGVGAEVDGEREGSRSHQNQALTLGSLDELDSGNDVIHPVHISISVEVAFEGSGFIWRLAGSCGTAGLFVVL